MRFEILIISIRLNICFLPLNSMDKLPDASLGRVTLIIASSPILTILVALTLIIGVSFDT